MIEKPASLADQLASLRAAAEAHTGRCWLTATLEAMIMAALARIFGRLEELVRLWQDGLLPALPARAASPRAPGAARAAATVAGAPCPVTIHPSQPPHLSRTTRQASDRNRPPAAGVRAFLPSAHPRRAQPFRVATHACVHPSGARPFCTPSPGAAPPLAHPMPAPGWHRSPVNTGGFFKNQTPAGQTSTSILLRYRN